LIPRKISKAVIRESLFPRKMPEEVIRVFLLAKVSSFKVKVTLIQQKYKWVQILGKYVSQYCA